MFKYFKKIRELKKTKLQFETALMSKLFSFVNAMPDFVELAKKAKDMDINEIQKLIVETLVDYTMSKEDTVESE